MQSRLRQAEDDNRALKDQLEEEEDQKMALQKQISDLQFKVSLSWPLVMLPKHSFGGHIVLPLSVRQSCSGHIDIPQNSSYSIWGTS